MKKYTARDLETFERNENKAKPLHGYYIVSENNMETLIQAGPKQTALAAANGVRT